MNIYPYIYLVSVLFCLSFNLGIYDKLIKSTGRDRVSCLITLFVTVFLGPISIAINLYFTAKYVKNKYDRYLYEKKLLKTLESVIEEKLFEALKENGIAVEN